MGSDEPPFEMREFFFLCMLQYYMYYLILHLVIIFTILVGIGTIFTILQVGTVTVHVFKSHTVTDAESDISRSRSPNIAHNDETAYSSLKSELHTNMHKE